MIEQPGTERERYKNERITVLFLLGYLMIHTKSFMDNSELHNAVPGFKYKRAIMAIFRVLSIKLHS